MNVENDEVTRGVQEHLAGNLVGAESAYKTALQRDENNATAHNNLGFIYGQQGRWEEAKQHLNTALELNPNMSMAHANLGQVIANLGEMDEGISHLEKAVALDPQNVQAWNNLGRFRMLATDYQGAEYAWIRSDGLTPNDSCIQTRLGTAIAAQRRFTEALHIYQQVLDINPDYVDAWVQLGIVHFLREDIGSARKSLEKALSLNAEDTNAIRHLGLVYLASGEKNKAIEAFKHVVDLDQDDTSTRLDLAIALLSEQLSDEALFHLKMLNQSHKNNGRITFYLGLALRQTNNVRQGNDLLRQLVSSTGEYSEKAKKILSSV